MKKELKLKKVQDFLNENHIKHEKRELRFGHSNIWLPELRIAIKVEGKDDRVFFDTHHKGCFPCLFVKMRA